MVPAYDAERYIGEALESALAQTHPAIELIVVDDGSSDDSAGIARRACPDAVVVEEPHRGEAAARNRTLELARGEYLAFLDADDIWDPRKIELQVAAASRGEVDLVFCHQRAFRTPELGPSDPRYVGEEVERAAVVAGALLATRSSFERIGGFGDWRLGAFLDWLSRARRDGLRETVVPNVLLHRRMHPDSHSVRNREHLGTYAQILKSHLDGQRSAGR